MLSYLIIPGRESFYRVRHPHVLFVGSRTPDKNSKVDHAPQESGCSSPSSRPEGREPLMSMMRGQCDARPTVTFPAARQHHPLAGTKLYCLVTEARVLTTYAGLHSTVYVLCACWRHLNYQMWHSSPLHDRENLHVIDTCPWDIGP